MAQGGIRKGFFFYFGLFVLLLVTIFCICLVIMIFNPGKTILWMQYFSSSDYVKIDSIENNNINWSQVQSVTIECNSYADIVVDRNNNTKMPDDAVYIINNSKGFTAAAGAVQFDYDVTFSNGNLNIKITEPTGFMYFSKDFQVVLHACTDRNVDFSNISLDLKTEDGSVVIGGSSGTIVRDVKPRSLTIETGSGDISFTEHFDKSNLTSLNVTTDKGKISSGEDVQVNGISVKGLDLPCDASFDIEGRGLISFGALIDKGHDVTLTNKHGNVDISYIDVNKLICSNCVEGNFLFGNIYGDVIFDSTNTLISPNIMADHIGGDFQLTVNRNMGGEPDIDIKEIGGSLSIIADKGSLKVGNVKGDARVSSEGNMAVNLTLDSSCRGVEILNNQGLVNLTFTGQIPKKLTTSQNDEISGVAVTNDTGRVTINITNEAVFTAEMYVNDGKVGDERTLIDVNDSRLKINIGNDMIKNHTKNPLVVGDATSSDGSISITTNGDVEFNLVA